jgi:hypothetical protein
MPLLRIMLCRMLLLRMSLLRMTLCWMSLLRLTLCWMSLLRMTLCWTLLQECRYSEWRLAECRHLLPRLHSLGRLHPQILDLDGFQVSFFEISSDIFDVRRRRLTTDGKADRSFGSVQAEPAFDEDRRAARARVTSRGSADNPSYKTFFPEIIFSNF